MTKNANRTYFIKLYIFMAAYIITAMFIIYFAYRINFKPVDSAFLNLSASTIVENTGRKTIVIDAGHGGIDGGAVGVDDVLEKDLNLEVALKLKALFKLSDVDVIMTREEDVMLNDEAAKRKKASDLSNRVQIAKNYSNAVFVSIHMNKFTQEKYYGLQVFYSPNNLESAKLALKLQEYGKKYLQPELNREVKRGKDIYILENLNNCAVLVECGFLSNVEESKKLANDDYQNKLAFILFNAILDYMGES